MWVIRTLITVGRERYFKYYSNDNTVSLAMAKEYASEKDATDAVFDLFGFWEVCTYEKARKEAFESSHHWEQLRKAGNLCSS